LEQADSPKEPDVYGSGRNALTGYKGHDKIIIKTKTGRDYNGTVTGKMPALRKRQCKKERESQEWQTAFSVLQ
jgi:hypothetical protein